MKKLCVYCIYRATYLTDQPCKSCLSSTDKPRFTPANYPESAQESQEGSKINDPVCHPGHYTSLPLEAIKTIRLALTEAYGSEGFKAYCFGNELKYRLRAGFKGDAQEDINKALKYAEFRKGNFE